jgi:hypothetical protein
MIIQVKNNPDDLVKNEIVAFLTGEKSVNTYPKFLRVGKVIKGYNSGGVEIVDLSTGKIWKPYSGDIIKIGNGAPVQGVEAHIKFTERV